jgi:hypothetical protein
MCSDPWKPTAEDQTSCDADDLLPAGQVPGLVEWAGSFCILRHSDADVRAMNVRHPAAPKSFLQGNRRSVTITKNPLSACVFTITIRPLSNRHQGGILLRTPATVLECMQRDICFLTWHIVLRVYLVVLLLYLQSSTLRSH